MDKQTEERIRADAEAYATLQWGDMAKFLPNDIQHAKWDNSLDDYIAGATAENEKLKEFALLLNEIKLTIEKQKTGIHLAYEVLINKINKALEQWKGKEVEDEG